MGLTKRFSFIYWILASASYSLLPAAFTLLDQPSAIFSKQGLVISTTIVVLSFLFSFVTSSLFSKERFTRAASCLNLSVVIRSLVSLVGFFGLLVGRNIYPGGLALTLPDSATLIFSQGLYYPSDDSVLGIVLSCLSYGALILASLVAVFIVLCLLSFLFPNKTRPES